MSTAALTPLRNAETSDAALGVAPARAVSFALLATFGALHWMAMLEPAATARGWYALLAGAAAMAGLLAAGRLHGRRRPAACALVTAAVATLALLGGGVADELLRPDRWGELVAGIGRGLGSLPGARVPYRGLDEWTRLDLALGGTLLTALAGLVAFWPRRSRLGLRYVALVLLVALYAVPAVALDFEGEFVRGAALALLVLAFLRLETLRVNDAGAAAALAVAVAVLGLLAAPALDGADPWWDYENWALSNAAAKTTSFSWDHTYGPLDWPRDGRELLRVKARLPAYWKAMNLDTFDGRRWVRDRTPSSSDGCLIDTTVSTASRARWIQDIDVTVRNLRSPTFITAGIACGVLLPRVFSLPLGDGTYATATRPLRRGDAYTAKVYTPQPTERQRLGAGDLYLDYLTRYRRIALSGAGPDPNSGEERSGTLVTFPQWNLGGEPEAVPEAAPDRVPVPAAELLASGPYARIWRLARRLKEGVNSQEEYVQRVDAFLGRGFSYTEAPPLSAENLDGFLFDAKAGYCQQFSGAMALLLRMGGVPARVATGFTPGAYDRDTKEYVVRDLDAHSWVEAWYPSFGWVTFDPTPAIAPARSQPAEGGARGSAGRTVAPSLGGEIATDPVPRGGAGATGTPWGRIALLAALGAALLGLALAGLRRRRARRLGQTPGPLGELERALRRTRRVPGPGTTLQALESALARTPAAAGYVRAVREQRYGARPAEPTPAQRRALRSELGRGAGLAGRLRAWWAVPPRPH